MMLLWRPGGNMKPGDSFRQQHETWRRAYAGAYSVRERFPRVEELVLDMAFTDRRAMGTYSAQMRSFSASAKAFFAIPCPRTLCLEGGFDLDAMILSMLGAGATTSTGTLECHGWVKPTRTEDARCVLQMHYRLRARYDAPEASTSKRRTRA
jgi:hypothetical protein